MGRYQAWTDGEDGEDDHLIHPLCIYFFSTSGLSRLCYLHECQFSSTTDQIWLQRERLPRTSVIDIHSASGGDGASSVPGRKTKERGMGNIIVSVKRDCARCKHKQRCLHDLTSSSLTIILAISLSSVSALPPPCPQKLHAALFERTNSVDPYFIQKRQRQPHLCYCS